MKKRFKNRHKNIRKKDYLLLIKKYDAELIRSERWVSDYETQSLSFEFSGEKEQNYYAFYLKHFEELLTTFNKNEDVGYGTSLKDVNKRKLNLYEGCIIYMYTAHWIFDHINNALKECSTNIFNNINEDVKLYRILLNKALKKMPSCNNKTVYRDISLSEEYIANKMNKYKIGQIVTFSEFLSTHQRDSPWGDKLVLKIKTKVRGSNGKSISGITLVKDENEVLFRSPTKFLVTDIDKNLCVVYLDEL